MQAEDGIRDLVRSRGLGDVYKRQGEGRGECPGGSIGDDAPATPRRDLEGREVDEAGDCLLYTSDAADERSSVDLGGRRIINKQKHA